MLKSPGGASNGIERSLRSRAPNISASRCRKWVSQVQVCSTKDRAAAPIRVARTGLANKSRMAAAMSAVSSSRYEMLVGRRNDGFLHRHEFNQLVLHAGAGLHRIDTDHSGADVIVGIPDLAGDTDTTMASANCPSHGPRNPAILHMYQKIRDQTPPLQKIALASNVLGPHSRNAS